MCEASLQFCVCVWRKCCPFWPFCIHTRGGTAVHVSSAHVNGCPVCETFVYESIVNSGIGFFSPTCDIVMVIIWLVSAVWLCYGEERPGELGWLPLLEQSTCLNKRYTVQSSTETVLWERSKRSVSRSELWIALLFCVMCSRSCLLHFYFCVSHVHRECSFLIWNLSLMAHLLKVGSENRLSREAL